MKSTFASELPLHVRSGKERSPSPLEIHAFQVSLNISWTVKALFFKYVLINPNFPNSRANYPCFLSPREEAKRCIQKGPSVVIYAIFCGPCRYNIWTFGCLHNLLLFQLFLANVLFVFFIWNIIINNQVVSSKDLQVVNCYLKSWDFFKIPLTFKVILSLFLQISLTLEEKV